MTFNGPYFPNPSPEEIEKQIINYQARLPENNWPSPRGRLLIADKSSDQLLGNVSSYWIGKESNWLAIGLVIYDSKNWSKGLGAEALTTWINYLFKARPEIVRLDMRTWSGNTGMMKLAEKLGFQLEARFRKARIVNGEYYDGIGYGILREEWSDK